MRGVGVVEEHLSSLDRVATEEEYERNAFTNGAVPSVAVITPSSHLDAKRWQTRPKQIGWTNSAGRRVNRFSYRTAPPLSRWRGHQPIRNWSEARHMSLLDVANMFNLDGYWFGRAGDGPYLQNGGP